MPSNDAKAQFRQRMRARRRDLAVAAPMAMARLLVLVREANLFHRGQVVAGYWPLGDELDPRPLLTVARQAGADIVLPRVERLDSPLVFRRWNERDELAPDKAGVPAPTENAPEKRPDTLLIPLLAFDGRGHRLGYGKGYYDRTLAQLAQGGPPVRAVGLAYQGQRVATLPANVHDQPLDAVLTEQGLQVFSRSWKQ